MTREQLGLFAIAFLVVVGVALGYRRRSLASEAKATRAEQQTNDCKAENTLLRAELREVRSHADYFEALSEWQEDHQRVPTEEEQEAMWLRIRAKIQPPPMVKLPDSFSYFTIDGLIRASGGKVQ